MAGSEHDAAETVREFHDAVNMTPAALEKWLDTDESREVGQKTHEGDESVGHEMGRQIVALLHKKRGDGYTDDDTAHMRKVVGYVHRHLAQRPDGEIAHTRWRYSLMNWGHDPTKDHATPQ